MFMPPTPASRNLRPTEGMASNSSTCTPPCASTSAAISPAGPPPMTATTGITRSFPLDRCRGFAADVIDDAVDAAYFIDDAVGDLAEQGVGQLGPVGGHEVLGLHRTQRHHVVVGAAVTHDADRLHRQEHGEGLRGFLVPAARAQFLDEDGVGPAQQVGVFALHFAEDAHAEA